MVPHLGGQRFGETATSCRQLRLWSAPNHREVLMEADAALSAASWDRQGWQVELVAQVSTAEKHERLLFVVWGMSSEVRLLLVPPLHTSAVFSIRSALEGGGKATGHDRARL